MKVLMFGWEFPPFKSGGLGTVCYDLTKGLSEQNVDVTFVMPSLPDNADSKFLKLVGANKFCKNIISRIKFKKVDSILMPYMNSQTYEQEHDRILHERLVKGTTSSMKDIYGANLHEEVYRYSLIASELAKDIDETDGVDIIHAHDWMTFQAGINAKKALKKPLVVHIHNTVFDRYAGNSNEYEYKIELAGFRNADKIIAISNWIKNTVVEKYGINPDKIEVIHWGIAKDNPAYHINQKNPFKGERVVLALGRVTIQKGLDYLVKAAKKVLEHVPNTRFVIVGEGDMMDQIINMAGDYGILSQFTFTGWLKGDDVHKAFQMADLYVMPSVSEPFGVVALESLKNNTPVLLSKQSGAAEVIHNALKVDFWDVDEIANKIINVLKYSELHDELRKNSFNEVQKFDLYEPARRCKNVYNRLTHA